jgi:hypothetical protein
VLDRKAAGVAVAVVGAALAGHRGKAEEDGGLLADCVQELGFAEAVTSTKKLTE